ncbi:MAG: acyl-CoA thioesterase [Crocinitomicaceae bacterium]|nr:acyl-CoA thioesterase [Crocinitomicaceae bacterium]
MIKAPVQVRFADCDIAGHIHNAVYLHYFESGRMYFFVSQLGYDWDWKAKGIILKKNTILYHSPGLLTDQLSVEVECTHIGDSSFTLSYKVKNQTGEVRAEGESILVCMNYAEGKKISIPQEFLEILKKHLNSEGQ